MVAVVNLLAAGGSAVMVLFAQEKLGLDSVGFGPPPERAGSEGVAPPPPPEGGSESR
jgi:hypothetical protein